MKGIFVLFFCAVFFFFCKKKETLAVVTEPEPVKTCAITFSVILYDSLGQMEADKSGVAVSLIQTSFSAITNSTGIVNFSNVPYGLQTPVLLKNGYEGPPLFMDINSTAVSVTLPFPKHSPFIIQNLSGQLVNKDSITLSFNLDKSLPNGKTCKICVLTSTASSLNANNFGTADVIEVSSQYITKINVAKLTNIKAGLAALAINDVFYIGAIPVSYGVYESNLYSKSVLLGDNLFYADNLKYSKNW